MKETPHITLSEEKEKQDTIHCAMYAAVVVFGMLALLCHGIAFLSWTEETNEDVYSRNRMEKEIIVLRKDVNNLSRWWSENTYDLKNHKHRFWTGKIKKEVIE